MQEVFETLLPPTQLPLDELLDYDLIRFAFNKMMKAEGLKSLWKTGQDPPASVQEWWGNEDWEVFRLYENQNISKDTMDLIRARHQRYKRNAINFFKDKLRACYSHRLGADNVDSYHMRISNRELEALKQRKIQKKAEAQNVLAEAEAEEQERKIAAAVEERVQREVNERVEKALKEQRTKQKSRESAATLSPKRRKKVFEEDDSLDEDEAEDVVASHLPPSRSFPPMPAISDRIDPNSSILQDPCAIAVVRAPSPRSSPGPSRPTRQMYKCPFEGCFVIRKTEEALQQHLENNHD